MPAFLLHLVNRLEVLYRYSKCSSAVRCRMPNILRSHLYSQVLMAYMTSIVNAHYPEHHNAETYGPLDHSPSFSFILP